ncbi:hypothetical protein BJB45_09045 [Halomonas huangheensis]|uniref:tRNA(Met) cytidine acetyltransferase TmcA n=2 Tax=Halomonas huangheensis TaxID=1178482 RepID=W1NAY7_9GAMM|nr:hypothetical protein AR456_17955 [Halomonas huangheensis]ERL52100.1 hypothetical protein BJB45_09045 [Halomonas huangheensis]
MSALLPSRAIARLNAWRSLLAARRWRGLVWITGDVSEARRAAQDLLASRDWCSPLWIGKTAVEKSAVEKPEVEKREVEKPEVEKREAGGAETAEFAGADSGLDQSTITFLSSGQARTRLGAEHELVIIDAVGPDAGLDPDALGAVAGTVVAGGLLVLLTADDGGSVADADYQRLAAWPWRVPQLTSHYLARCHHLLQSMDGIARWRPGHALEVPELAPDKPPGCDGETAMYDDCLTEDQATAVAQLVRLRRRRPLVLTADRGRGKSASLGIACGHMLAEAEQRGEPVQILLTAPRPAAVEAVFEHCVRLRPAAMRSVNRVETAGGVLRFVAADALSAQVAEGEAGGPGSLLLVDEAAAIPAALLGEWLEAFPRIAFATTEHGYEGSGRGFALRFRRRLDTLTPQWRSLKMESPIRWAVGDPLEEAITQLLMLDADLVDTPRPSTQTTLVDRANLATDEPALRGIFGLLVQAHYRTTPADLRALLDAPEGALMTLGSPSAPAGVVVWGDEGGFDTALAEQVACGRRRPRGHLLAQSLAVHAGEPGALTARVRRITRVAVHPGVRRQGAGSQLLEAAFQQACADGMDLLGASFGGDAELLAFWRSQGYRVVRLGLTRETATGEHALMVLKACTERGAMQLERLERRFRRLLPRLLAFELRELAPSMVLALLCACAGRDALDDLDQADLDDVTTGHRDLALVRPAIQQLIHVASGVGMLEVEDAWLSAWAFQGRSEAQLARGLALSGRAQVKHWLRGRAERLLRVVSELSSNSRRG